MARFLIFLIFSLFITITANAGVCSDLPVKSLVLNSSNLNICTKTEVQLSDVEKNILNKLRAIHLKVAAQFNFKLQDFPLEPYTLEFNESLFGWLPSLASKNGILMTVYPNTDFDFNESVYIHELAHLISYSESNKFPLQIKELHRAKIFAETFADLLALSVTSQVIIPKSETNCLDKLRFIGTHQTYGMNISYFQNFTEKRLKNVVKD